MAFNNAINAPTPFSVENGGTGAETLTQNGILYGNGTDAVSATAELADGELLVGSTGNAPVPTTLTAGSGISITNDAGEITITSTAAQAWVEVTGTTQAMENDTQYIANNAALVTLTLPTTAAVGERVGVTGAGEGGWRIAQNADQQIHFGNVSSTVGTSGYLEFTHRRDTVELVCVVADTEWNVIDSIGQIDIE
jgi:hypothetical protein